MPKLQTIGLFGGTFDPVHIGHLRTALDIRQQLQLDEMRLIPCAEPYHRENSPQSIRHRRAMLELAVADNPLLSLETCELERPGPSYTVETLAELRQKLGDDVSLVLCLGMDSLSHLASWHRWRSIIDLAHIFVACRPGFTPPGQGDVAEFIHQRAVTDGDLLHAEPHGYLLIRPMTLLPVSSTVIRDNVQRGYSLKYLVPDNVAAYIKQHKLYQTDSINKRECNA